MRTEDLADRIVGNLKDSLGDNAMGNYDDQVARAVDARTADAIASIVGKALPERMDGAETALAAFKLEMDRELKTLKKTGQSGRRERERLAWIEFAAAAAGGMTPCAWADEMLDRYRERFEKERDDA